MIEAKLKKWISEEIEDGVSTPEWFSKALIDDDYAADVWREFASWHRDDLCEIVRQQVKAVLKKNKKTQPNPSVIGS